MTTSLDDKFTPHLDEAQLAVAMQKPSAPIKTDLGTMAADKQPTTDLRSVHDRILQAATHKYARLLRRVAYPYGVDPYTQGPLEPSGTPVANKPEKPPKALRNLLWHRVYKKTYKKHLGQHLPKGMIAAMPKFNSLTGNGLYTYGDGIVARGTSGGALLGTAISLAAPLIIQGVKKLIPIIVKAIKKRKAKKAAKKAAKNASNASNAAELVKGIQGTADQLKDQYEEDQDEASAQGAGKKKKPKKPEDTKPKQPEYPLGKVPTPFQAEQAKEVADRAASRGMVGYPNPLAFPAYPPSLMDPTVPIDALTFWRDVYNKIKLGIVKTAAEAGLPPKYAVPYIDKFIRATAYKTFGRGGAKLILDTNYRGKPLKIITPYHLLAPILEHSVDSPEHRKILKRFLKRTPLTRPTTGQGIGDILSNLIGFIDPEHILLPSIAMSVKEIAKSVGSFLADKLGDILSVFKPLTSDVPYNWLERLKRVGENIAEMPNYEMSTFTAPEATSMPEELGKMGGYIPEGSGTCGHGISGRNLSKQGKVITAYGGSLWDSIKTITLLAGEIGAPIMGALAGKYFNAPKYLRKGFEAAGNAASEAIGDIRTISQINAAHKEALDALDKKKKELEAAAALTPELYSQLKREAEMGKILLNQVKGKKGFDVDEFAPMKKWTMSRDEYGGLHRSYMDYDTSGEIAKALAKRKNKYKDLFGKDKYKSALIGESKENKALKKYKKLLSEVEYRKKLGENLSWDELDDLYTMENAKLKKKLEKKAKKKGIPAHEIQSYISSKAKKRLVGWDKPGRAALGRQTGEELFEQMAREGEAARRRRSTKEWSPGGQPVSKGLRDFREAEELRIATELSKKEAKKYKKGLKSSGSKGKEPGLSTADNPFLPSHTESPLFGPEFESTGHGIRTVAPIPGIMSIPRPSPRPYRFKRVKNYIMTVGPTSDAAIRGRVRAGQIMTLAKKME
jgi:hypothetical protein